MRVLIVDNDAFSKANAKIFLQSVGSCEEADDRDAALANFRSAIESDDPYRLVLVDIQATDTGDDSILTALRSIEDQQGVPGDNRARIFVVTAMTGRQLVTDCLMNGCDEFFTKPLDKNRLFGKLNTYDLLARKPEPSAGSHAPNDFLTPSDVLDTAVKRLKKSDLNLPPAPKIAMRLRQMLDCDAEIKDVVELLRQDLSVATKLISVSNSAFYRGIEKSTTLSQATQRLGLTRTREVVMSICCRGYFATNHQPYKEVVEKLWWHSLACAHTTEMLAQEKGMRLEDDIFSIGLLHDIGKLFLIQVAGDLQQKKKARQPVDMEDLQPLMDDNHERLGAGVLDKLGYPETFVALVRRHHRFDDSQTVSRSLQLLQQADLLAKAAGFGLGLEPPESIRESMQSIGIDETKQQAAAAEIVQRMDQLRYVFG